MAVLFALASCGTSTTNTASKVVSSVATETTTTSAISTKENIAKIGRTEDGAITYGEGKVRLQIFADFQCPFCQIADTTVTPMLESLAEAGKITLEYRQFPLTKIHDRAFADANSAMCVADENLNAYRSYKTALYALEKARGQSGKVSDDDRIALLEQLGIATDSLKNCIKNQEKSDLVKKEMAYGEKQGITGTPTYLMDGKAVNMSGFKQISDFQDLIEKYYDLQNTTVSAETATESAPADDANGMGGVVELAAEDATKTAESEKK